MVPVEQFWDQYKENLRNRTPLPKRLARLAFAFVTALVVGSACYVVDWLTGSRAAVLVVGIILALMAVVFWWIVESIFSSRSAPIEAAVIATAVEPAPLFSPTLQPGVPPLAQAYRVMPPPPAKSLASRVLVALAGVFCVAALSCCGGLAVIGVMLSRPRAVMPVHVPRVPNQPPLLRPQPFGNPQRRQQEIETAIRRQQEQIEATIRRQQQQVKETIRRQKQQFHEIERRQSQAVP